MDVTGSPVPRLIAGFRRDGAQVVVLALDCGHRRHVRHRPPLSEHRWVLDDDAVRARLGEPIECLRCTQRLLPEGAEGYRRTRTFDEESTPAGLRTTHRTKAGVWGLLWVGQGQLELSFEQPLFEDVLVDARQPAAIPPQLPHRVRLTGPVRFYVEFLRPPALDG